MVIRQKLHRCKGISVRIGMERIHFLEEVHLEMEFSHSQDNNNSHSANIKIIVGQISNQCSILTQEV
jgi:hypothetical protein